MTWLETISSEDILSKPCNQLKYLVEHVRWCMIKIFRGRKGVVDGEGVSSERCLKWGGGGWGSLRNLSKTS